MDIILTNGSDNYRATLDVDTDVNALAGDDDLLVNGANGALVRLYGGTGRDQIVLNGVNVGDVRPELYGEDGNDVLVLVTREGLARGGAGDDYIEVDAILEGGGGTIYGDEGNDQLIGNVETEAHGGAGADYVSGKWSFGDDGGDVVYAFAEGWGGAGDDRLGGIRLNGEDGDDELIAQERALGGTGFDLLKGRGMVWGESGADVFFPFATSGYEIMDFEHGLDRIATPIPVVLVDEFTGTAGQAVSSEVAPGQNKVSVDRDGDGAADHEFLTGAIQIQQSDFILQTFDGSNGADVKNGTARNELMLGSDGNDRLDGSKGDDWLFGGFGADYLSGGGGKDLLVGNGGHDRLYGGSGDDTLSAGDGDDLLSASQGNDWADGGAGEDKLAGGDGADTLIGGEGRDHLTGGAGDDVLIGGAGGDQLWGNEGADRFVFRPGDGGASWGTRDRVWGFTPGEDKIDLTAFDAVLGNGGPGATSAEVSIFGGWATQNGVIVWGETTIHIDFAGGPDYSDDVIIVLNTPLPLFQISDILL